MGCSGSKEEAPQAAPRPERIVPPIPESEADDHKTKPSRTLNTTFDTHTTEASSFSGFRGSGPSLPSFQSLPSTIGSNPRSEGGSEMSLFSASSKRSVGGFGAGDKLSELSDEEGFEEDFEDDEDEAGSVRGGRARPGDRPTPLSAAGAAPAPASRYEDGALTAVNLYIRKEPGVNSSRLLRRLRRLAPFNLPCVLQVTSFPSCVPHPRT